MNILNTYGMALISLFMFYGVVVTNTENSFSFLLYKVPMFLVGTMTALVAIQSWGMVIAGLNYTDISQYYLPSGAVYIVALLMTTTTRNNLSALFFQYIPFVCAVLMLIHSAVSWGILVQA